MKKILLFIVMVIFCVQSFAENMAYIISDFSGGQNSHISPYNEPGNKGAEAKNVRTNYVYSALSNRDRMINVSTVGTDQIRSLFRYYKSDSSKFLIATTGTKIYYDIATGTMTEARQGMTTGVRYQWQTYQDMLIGANAYDAPVIWDGDVNVTDNTDGNRTAGDIFSELGAPFAELNTGSTLDASSWYQYKIAYYDGTSYTYCTARSNPLLTGATVRDITLTHIPLGPAGTTQRIIYRTVGLASRAAVVAATAYYKVATISDNITVSYNDSVSDATILGDTAPTWATVSAGGNVSPPVGEIISIHKERLFKNSSTDSSYIYWSSPYLPHYFDTTKYEVIREDDGDKITFILEFLGVLRVGKTNSILNFYTSEPFDVDWYASAAFSNIGCQATYSAKSTAAGLFYINRSGLYSFNGQSVSLISDAITDEIRDISDSDIERCTAAYFKNEYYLSYTSNSSGASYNDRVLIYDIVRDSYVYDTKNIDSFCTYNSGDDFGAMLGGSSAADGKIWVFSFSASVLSVSTKTALDAGTYSSARSYGTDLSPVVDLGWSSNINGWLAELKTISASVNTLDDIDTYIPGTTIDRPYTTGTWTSPVYQISASSFDKLYWNEYLGSFGNVTLQIRAGATSSACTGASWSSAVTDSLGSDVSGVPAGEYTQVRINLSTTDISETPYLFFSKGFVFKLVYFKQGSTLETGVNSLWDTGWKSLQDSSSGQIYRKQLNRIKVYYTGSEGVVNVRYLNDEGDIDENFDIDLSVNPPYDIDGDGFNDYISSGERKIFTYTPKSNLSSSQSASIGQKFRFIISSVDAGTWVIEPIEVRYEIVPFSD